MIPVLKCTRQQWPYTTRPLRPAIKPQVILIQTKIRVYILQNVQSASGAHPTCSAGIGASYPERKAVGA